MHTVRREYLPVGGATVSALTAGGGEPVILLHGIPTGAELWRPLFHRLAGSGLRLFAPDLPGYGRTAVPARTDHSLTGAADLVARWIAEQHLRDVWLVGHDAGGAVAQVVAVEHPERVARLTLVNSVVDGSWPAPRARLATLAARARLYRPAAALRLVPNPYLRWQVRRGFADRRRAAAVDGDRVFWDGKFSHRDGRAAFERHLAALTPRDTARIVPGLRRLHVPSQLVWGTADVFQPWDVAGRRLADLLPSPAITLLNDCGHFVPLECPQLLATALLGWHAEVAA